MKERIEDFGQKIGGARKDLWQEGLTLELLDSLNDAEKAKYVIKDNVWPNPVWIDVVESGVPVFVAYWQREIRRLVWTRPALKWTDSFDEAINDYVHAVSEIRDRVMAVKTEEDIFVFEFESAADDYDYKHWKHVISISDLRSLRYKKGKLRYRMDKNNFPEPRKYNVSKRKKSFVPPQLTKIERTGEDYRHGIHVTPARWQEDFFFRGVEFGNWTTQKERQLSMDYCYDALRDLAYALQIDVRDIAFQGELSLAFGARGHSAASSHYESLREVINLTKMNGAGCTAKEWFHALDDKLSKFCQCSDKKFASETEDIEKLPKSYLDLIRALKVDANGNPTDYYRGSRAFDGHFRKASHGKWSSTCEMMARAFACYVKDILCEKSDYLIAHADVYEFEFENQSICAHPQGEERDLFDELFDRFFFELKEIGFFHQPTTICREFGSSYNIVEKSNKEYHLNEENGGQYSMFIA